MNEPLLTSNEMGETLARVCRGVGSAQEGDLVLNWVTQLQRDLAESRELIANAIGGDHETTELQRLRGEHENIARGRIPTHRCKVCGTFWMDLGPYGYKAMSMVGIWCGDSCCIGDNVELLPALTGSLECITTSEENGEAPHE